MLATHSKSQNRNLYVAYWHEYLVLVTLFYFDIDLLSSKLVFNQQRVKILSHNDHNRMYFYPDSLRCGDIFI